MTDNHPITPPPELVQQWCHEEGDEIKTSPRWYQIVATKAARWGADQELMACCTWLSDHGYIAADPDLRAARRPKPPSLKEQALEALETIPKLIGFESERDAIRRALEALPND
jgi:hypothetical protein